MKGKCKVNLRGPILPVENKVRIPKKVSIYFRKLEIVSSFSAPLKCVQIFLKPNKTLTSFMTWTILGTLEWIIKEESRTTSHYLWEARSLTPWLVELPPDIWDYFSFGWSQLTELTLQLPCDFRMNYVWQMVSSPLPWGEIMFLLRMCV
jgi:hypothetical protein